MTPEQFAYWLQGYVELTRNAAPDEAQWKSICEHLSKVFVKTTPQVGPAVAHPAVTPKSLEDAIRRFNEQRPAVPTWPFSPGSQPTITC